MSRIDIAPSLLAADFLKIGDEAESVMRAGARLLHIDVMDGLFVPNFALSAEHVRALRPLADRYNAKVGVHLMIVRPERHLEMFRASGSDLIFIHAEAGPHPYRTLRQIRTLGMRAGLTVAPGTSLAMVEELLGVCDDILVMGVNPGFGGQTFIPETLDKIQRVREMVRARRLHLRVSVDGGVTTENIGLIAGAGAEIAISGSSVFGNAEGVEASLEALRSAAVRLPASDPKIYWSTASAKPSASFDATITFAALLTKSLALPTAMPNPTFRNICVSLFPSPMAAMASSESP